MSNRKTTSQVGNKFYFLLYEPVKDLSNKVNKSNFS